MHHPLRASGFALATLFLSAVFSLNLHAVEVVTLVDLDQNVSTGCVLQTVPGIDAVATVKLSSTASGMTVSSLRMQRCAAGTLGPVVKLADGWPVPRDERQFNVEAYVPYAELGISRTTPARYAFVLIEDGKVAARVPAEGSMLTFSAPSRRRAAPPAEQGPAAAADGNLSEWFPSQKLASNGAMSVWMRSEAEMLVLRFDVLSGAPIANDDDYVAPSGATLTVHAPGVLANDSDPERDPLTAELVTPATHGTITLDSDGSFVYQHDGSSEANDTFTYRARDPFTASAPATVTLTPVIVSRPPLGNSDTYSTLEDQPLPVAAPGVLGNDSDPDHDELTAELDSAPAASEGTVSLHADGSFTFTPAANFHGTATFTYRVSDGTTASDPVTVTITVTPVNDAPSFTISTPPASNEDAGLQTVNAFATSISAGPNESGQTLTFTLTPTGSTGTLTFAAAPAIDAVTGTLTYTAAADTSGTATFDVVLTDGELTALHSFTITVTAVNDAPSFTLPASTSSDEDAGAQTLANFAAAISAGPADESGQTLSFSLTQTSVAPTLTFSVAPSIATDGTLTYTAAPNAYGTATFNVVLTDDGGANASHPLTITINPINDAPSFTIATPPLASPEDGGLETVNAFATSISDGPNETGQTLTFSLTQTASTGTLAFTTAPAIATDGTLTYTAAPNTSGTATFDVVLTDDGGATATQSFTISVTAANDPPSFALPASTSSDEDAGAQSLANFATAISAGPADEAAQTLNFTVTQTSADATLTFSIAPSIATDGTLTYTVAPNAYGTATFNVVLTDDGGATASHPLTITINPINDAPSFTIATPPPATPEDGGLQTVNAFATSISDGPNETGQTLTFTLTQTASTGTLAFTIAPTIDPITGTLTYTAASNAIGTATFDVVLTDDGGATATQSFTITVTAVNDDPSFTLPSSTSSDEDAGAQTLSNFATAISAGPADESGQTLTFNISQTSADPSLAFTVAPSIATDGTLTYTAAPNAYGTATFNVVLTDDGGANASHPLTITINPINDAPSFTISTPPASPEDGGLQTVNAFATSISDGPNETGQTLTFTLTQIASTGTLAFTIAPAIDPITGTLTYTAAPNAIGTATFDAVLTDDGGATATQSFTITVTAVNDDPSFTLPSSTSSDEDTGAQTLSNFATAISAGPADESGQTLNFTVTPTSADPTVTFSIAPSIATDGTLTYTAAPNAYGTATFNVVLTDDGGATASHPLTITINPINDAPSFTIATPPPASPEDGGMQTVNAFATSISDGPNETGQTLTFTLTQTSSTGTLAFTTAPAIDPITGTLTYTAAPNTSGTATFDTVLTDDGGATATQSFTITVTAVNDDPSFTLPASTSSDEDAGAQTIPNFATAISAGPADESGETLTFSLTQTSADATLTFSIAPSIATDGTLTYTAAPNAYGTATFNVVLTDDGGATASHPLTITINAINDAPSFTIATPPPASPEDGGLQTVNAFATLISDGPNETGQTLTFTLTQTASTGTLTFATAPAIATDGTLTYTAAPNTSGTATFDAVLTDDGGASASNSFTITVNAVNDDPSFTLPASTSSDEDAGARTIPNFATAISSGPADESGQTLNFNISQTSADPTLTFSIAPSIAANGTLTYTAAPNAYGTATFNVILTDDGGANSTTHGLTITVNAVNDAPVANADTYSYPSDGSTLTVAAPGLLANDTDIDSGFLTVSIVAPPSEGDIILSPDGGFTYTKAASPSSTSITFTYVADDGFGPSNVATATIQLNAPPVANDDTFSMREDVTFSAFAPGLLDNDSDPDGNIALVQPVSGPNCDGYPADGCGSLSLGFAMDGSFTYEPPANFNGTVTFTYKLLDSGDLESAPATVTLNVLPVNDAPSFTQLITDASGAQNSSTVISVPFAGNILRGPLTAADETTQNVHFEYDIYTGASLLKPFVDAGSGIASTTGVDVDSTGTLRFMPGATTGTVRLWIRLVDDGGIDNGGVDDSDAVELVLHITAIVVNKAPSFNVSNVTVLEDAAAQSLTNWVTSISPGAGETSQTVTMSVDSFTNPSMFAEAPVLVSNTRLTYKLAPNAVGSSTLTIKAVDNGGTANGGVDTTTKTATITVTSVNDAPSFIKGLDLIYGSDTAGVQTVAGWATGISAGPSDESAQTLTFSATVRSGASIFNVNPAIAANGTLTFTLNGTTGLAVIDVRLSDNGGTANGGVNQSAIQTFTINAGGVNTPPSFVKGLDVTVLEDSGAATYGGWATSISPGAGESGQTVTFNVTATTPSLFSVQPAISTSGTLTFTPAANQFGSTTVTVRAVDDGGLSGGGVNTSDPQTFTINITGVNDAPTLSIPAPSVSGGENGGPRSIANFASATAGPSETGQTPFTYTIAQTGGSATLFDGGNGGVAPAISATGTLTFTTATNESGSATFSVTVRDAGGTANSGVDTSTSQSFTITIATGGPTVPGGSIAFNAYANLPITVGTLPAEASYNLFDGASDPDLPLSILITSKPTNARVDVAADGSFTFRSGNLAYASGAIQPQAFKWRVCDSIGNCSAERTANVSFIGPLVFFSDASAVTSPGLYTLDVPGKSIPTGFTTNAAPPATYIIKSGTYSMGSTGATTQLSLRAGDKVYGQGTAGLTLASLGITQAALTVGTLPALPDYSTGTIPTLHMPDPTLTVNGGIVITQSPFFKGYGGGSVKHLRFTRAAERTASWILFSNLSWTTTPGDYVFDDIISVNGQGFAIPQIGSSITVTNSNLTISDGFGMNGGTITVTNTPIQLTSTDTSNPSILFSDFDSTNVGTITATVDAASPITIANNVGHLFPITISNPAWMPNGTFTINSDVTITRTSTTIGLWIQYMSNVALNGKVTVTTATGKPVQLLNVFNLTMPHAANTAKMTSTPVSALNGGITMTGVTAGAAGINLTNIDVRKGYLAFNNTDGAPTGPITITGGTVVGDLINPCVSTFTATNVTVTGVTTSNCGF